MANRRSLILFLWLGLIGGCAAPPEVFFLPGIDRERFTRVNFRPDVGNLLRDSNFYVCQNKVRVGSTAKVLLYTRKELRLLLDGVDYRMVPMGELEFPSDPAGIAGLLEKYFVDSPNEVSFESLGPTEFNEDVVRGVPRVGMTKEQLYVCLGPPLIVGGKHSGLSLTRREILEEDVWIYGHQIVLGYPVQTTYVFGNDRLQKIGS